MTGTQKLLIRYQRAKGRPNISCTSCYFGKDALREKRERLRHMEERHVKTEIEIGVIHRQAKEDCQHPQKIEVRH